jgi:hypothetical protein
LENNSIEDEGAAFLATALRGNKSLEYLYLNNNNINYAGLHKLVETLDVNTSLKSLIIYNNSVQEEQAKEYLKRMGSDKVSVYNPLS